MFWQKTKKLFQHVMLTNVFDRWSMPEILCVVLDIFAHTLHVVTLFNFTKVKTNLTEFEWIGDDFCRSRNIKVNTYLKTASNVNIRQWKVACGVEFAQTIEIWRHFGVTWNEGSHKFYPLPLETTCSQKLAKPLGISTHTEVFSAQDEIRWNSGIEN